MKKYFYLRVSAGNIFDMKKLFVLFFLFFIAAPAYADISIPGLQTQPTGRQGITYTPLEPLPGIDQSGTNPNFAAFLGGFFTLLLTIGGIVAVGTLVIAGIIYMTSEVIGKKEEARKRIQNAVWGLLILISSYLILNTINPDLLAFKFFLGQTSGGQQPAPTYSTRINSETPTNRDIEDCENQQPPRRFRIQSDGTWRCE
ncbi:hypothetical protein A2852_01610 [Candidatus Adlerbacteria bacterium RIFCSPHIGHO2_01_FULL_54_23]|nr:MAG: hypothetical protein A2852_01610 [Candidatus Adlerbacteria bacterium RIFCSPHIGHO2_01_FULL_54_23]OGC86899.1 MAG: hypothetical protein A3B33_00955 [Candidatus Adlerbacteria bacterium RIFCSPLOWO2_01_FULL_54_16]